MPNRLALDAGAKAFVATCHVLASCDGPRAKRPSRIGVVGERHEVSEPRAPLPRATIAGSPCNGYVRRRKASAIAAALSYKHAARRGSTITSVGRSSPHTQLRCVDTAAARPPTPA